jgi:hypothetical protein
MRIRVFGGAVIGFFDRMRLRMFCALVIGFLLAVPLGGQAQSLGQLIEQLALDYEKLAQLKGMLSDMYTGYKKVYAGYEEVRGVAEGNFNLHKAFLDALLAVSPVVRDYVKVGNIINNEAALVKEYQNAQGYLSASGHLSGAELDGFNSLYGNLLNGSLRNLDELTDVLSDNTLRMSDAERLAAIDRIDRDMTSRLEVLRVFGNLGAIQAGQRGIELNDINAMQGLYNIGH